MVRRRAYTLIYARGVTKHLDSIDAKRATEPPEPRDSSDKNLLARKLHRKRFPGDLGFGFQSVG
jgi:hypothetical protein